MKMSNSTNKHKTKSCTHEKFLRNSDGMIVCSECGLVLDQIIDDAPLRTYTQKEKENKQRTEVAWRKFGPRTVFDGSDGTQGKSKSLYSRLSKINGSLVNSLERNYWEARPKLNKLSFLMSLPDHIRETAWKIYMEAAKQRLTMGRSIEGFIFASVYASIRVHKFPRILDEIMEYTELDTSSVHKMLSLVVRNVLQKLNLTYVPVQPKELIFHFGNILHLPVSFQVQAVNMYLKAKSKGMHTIGKSPVGYAIACIYGVCKNTEYALTQSELSDVGKITEVTVRARLNQIKNVLRRP